MLIAYRGYGGWSLNENGRMYTETEDKVAGSLNENGRLYTETQDKVTGH